MKTIKDTVFYKKVNCGRMNLKAKGKTQINTKSNIPVQKIQIAENLVEHDLLLKPSTTYSVDFYSDKESDLEFCLGGSQIVKYKTTIGFNVLSLTTPESLLNKNFVIKGKDVKISKVKIIETEEIILDYFEDLLSVHDYKSKNKNCTIKTRTYNDDESKQDVNELIINEPLRSMDEQKDRIIKTDNEWIIERSCIEINLKNNNWTATPYQNGYCYFVTTILNHPYSNPGVYDDFISNKYIVNKDLEDTSCYINVTEDLICELIIKSKQDISLSYFNKDITIILPLKEKRYEKLFNKSEAYTYNNVTHIENNSTVPCKMNIKNHGVDIRNLNPNQTYTAIYNSDDSLTLKVNGKEFELNKNNNSTTIITPETLTDNDILFYGKGKLSDFSLLEGEKQEIPKDYVKRLESSYESEIIDNPSNIYFNQYKVYIETNQRSMSLYIDEPLRLGDVIYTDNVLENNTILKRMTGQIYIDENKTITMWDEYNKNHYEYIGFCLEGFEFKNALNSKSLLTNECFPSYTLVAPDQIQGEHIVKVLNKIYLSIKASRLESRDIEGLKSWLSKNSFSAVYQLDEPQYTVLNESKMQLQVGSNSKISTTSNIPVRTISFNNTKEFGLKLKPSTLYRISFISNTNAHLDKFYCADVELFNIDIHLGQNTFLITTPETIENNVMIFNGQGFNISEVMITEGNTLFKSYFEDSAYLGELTEDNKYLIKVNDKDYLFDTPLRSTTDRKVADRLRYDYEKDKVVIERNVNEDLIEVDKKIEELDWTHDDLCLTTNKSNTHISFVSNLPIKAYVSNRGYRINDLNKIESHTLVIDGKGEIKAQINDSIATSSTGVINIVSPSTILDRKINLFGAGAETNSIMLIKGKDINTNGYFSGTKSCFEDKKITDPSNKNYGKYEAKFVVEGKDYYYIRTLYLPQPLKEGDFIERRTDGIYHIKDDKPTLISSDDFVLDIFENSELIAHTLIPLTKLTTINYKEEIKDIKPNTKYFISFISEENGELHYIDLGGIKQESIIVNTGLNTLLLTTPNNLLHNYLIFDGLGLTIKEVLVTEQKDSVVIDDVHYFEGTKSSYDSEYNDILKKYNAAISLCSKNIFNGTLIPVKVGDVIYQYTEYIPIDGYKKYVSNIIEEDSYMGQLFLYDKNKNQLYTEMIDTLIKTSYKNYPISSDIKYLQIRYLKRYENIQIEEGTMPSDYVPYFNSSVSLGLSTPLKEEDEIIYKEGSMYHYHGKTKEFEKVHNGIIKLNSIPNVTFNTFSAVPIDTVSTTRYKEEGLDIKPNTSYLLRFNSNKDGILNFIDFGGIVLSNVIVNQGINTRIINTLDSTNDKLIIDGQGIVVSHMIITQHIDDEMTNDINYFEGTKSSFEDKTVIIKSISEDKKKEDLITFNLTSPLHNGEVIEFRPYGVYHIHADGFEEELIVDKSVLEIFNKCKIEVVSNVPVRKVTSKEYEQRISKLKPGQDYVLKFDATNSTILNISLSGVSKQITVIKGMNMIDLRTPASLFDDTLILSAKNLILNNVLLIERTTADLNNVMYFDGIQSSFESEEIEVDGEIKYLVNITVSNDKGFSEDYKAYLSSPLLDRDLLVWDGKNLKHCHKTKLNKDTYELTLLDEPYYENITTDNPLFNVPAYSTIKVKTNIPIKEFITIDGFEENNLTLKPSTNYFIIFNSDKDGRFDYMSLGGSGLRNTKINKGKNCIRIKTPEQIESYSLKINGTGIQIQDLLIIEDTGGQLKESISYFKGMRHTFDEQTEDGKYKADILVVSYDKNETYHIDKKELLLNSPLCINDRIAALNESLYHIHNSRIVKLEGYESWRKENDISNDKYTVFSLLVPDMKGDVLISDKFITERIENINCERIWFNESRIYLSIAIENLNKNNITLYLEENPIVIVYDLVVPYNELLDDSELMLEMESKTNIYLKTIIPCKSLSISYNTDHINISDLNEAAIIVSNISLETLAQTWETDYKLSEIEWMLQKNKILTMNLKNRSMLVVSRYIQAKRLIENGMYNGDRMVKQINRYYEMKELTNEEYKELIEIIN